MSLFDLDHTLLKENSSFSFGAYLYREGFFNTLKMLKLASVYALHKLGLLSLASLHKKIFQKLFHEKSASQFQRLVDDFLDKSFHELLHMPAVDCLIKAQQRGDFIAILSNSPDFLVAKIANRLNVHFWKASIYSLDDKGNFSHISAFLEGKEKAIWMKKQALKFDILDVNISAYSDSILDLPFLEAAGEAIGVNPDKRLRKLCLRKGWKIL